jgi:hypothetical protein
MEGWMKDGWMDWWMNLRLTIHLNYETTYFMDLPYLKCHILSLIPIYSYVRTFL